MRATENLAEYVPLEALAAALNLPRPYLRRLARDGLIPSLNVNGRLRFDEGQVREALRRLAVAEADEVQRSGRKGAGRDR